MSAGFRLWARAVLLELLRRYSSLYGPVLYGKARLMKLTFLSMYKRIGKVVIRFVPERSDFTVWHHGPYSQIVDDIVSDLMARNVIRAMDRDAGLENPLRIYIIDRSRIDRECREVVRELERYGELFEQVREYVLGRISMVIHLYGFASTRRLEIKSLKVIDLNEISKERYKGMNVEDVIEQRDLKLVPINKLIS